MLPSAWRCRFSSRRLRAFCQVPRAMEVCCFTQRNKLSLIYLRSFVVQRRCQSFPFLLSLGERNFSVLHNLRRGNCGGQHLCHLLPSPSRMRRLSAQRACSSSPLRVLRLINSCSTTLQTLRQKARIAFSCDFLLMFGLSISNLGYL